MMGQTRTQQPEVQRTQRQPTPQEDAALIIFAILSGQAVFPNPPEIVAAALLALVPSSLPPRADISAEVARLVLTDLPDTPKGSGALSVATRDNLKYRVAYGFEAVQRLAKAIQDAKQGDEIGERLDKALKVEQGYFKAHQEAQAKRTEQDAMIEQAIKTYGNILSWHSVERPTSRPHHLAVDKMNWNAANGAPRATGVLPGTLPNCLCTFGPPIPGAPVIN